MADDISKKILIQVEADTDQLKQNVADLNQTLDGLLQKQNQLTAAGQQNGKAFDDLAAQVKTTQTAIDNQSKAVDSLTQKQTQLTSANQQNTKSFQDTATQVKAAQAAIDNHSKAIDGNAKAIGASNSSLQQNKTTMVALLQQYDSLSKAEGDHSAKIAGLNTQIASLSNTIAGQVTSLTQSHGAFDAHKATVNALSASFNQLKGVSGTFGPSLEEAAKGFESLKSGLDIVKTGFGSVGEAIKTTGFGLLVVVLQSVVDYFTKTSKGSKQLKGAISAVGKVTEIVHKAFAALGKIIIDAVTHPIDSLKALGNMIKDNIINRFKAFSVILDGIIHLDFKKVGDGVLQAATGVTNATDKIKTAFNDVKKGAEDTVNQLVAAYQMGYKTAGKTVDDHEKKVKKSTERLIGYHKKVSEHVKKTLAYQNNPDASANSGQTLTGSSGEADIPKVTFSSDPSMVTDKQSAKPASDTETDAAKKKAKEEAQIKAVEDYAKKSAGKIATDAFNTLKSSIAQQSAAKIAALEKDKAAELSNNSLTSAQKLAITQKYKQQEDAVKVKAFKEEQEASIAQAVINGALAITKGSSQMGVLAPLYIPIIIAETAVQVAKIAAQKPPAYAKGGLHYQSDGRGGILPGYSKTDNTNAHLRSGEGVIVSEAMQVPWARNLVSAINVGFGGRDFSMGNPGRGYAVGGIFTDGGDANRYYNQPVNDQKNLADTIAYQMINNFPPVYVDVKDVNNQQNILAQTINRVNL